jgi:hypothetical protein
MNNPSTNFAQIFQISASDGGVPKLSLRFAEVTPLGLTTDRHNDILITRFATPCQTIRESFTDLVSLSS